MSFDKKSGPGVGGTPNTNFGFPSPSPPPSPSPWFNNIKPPPSALGTTHKPQLHDLKRTRSPPISYKDILQNSTTTLPGSHPVPQRTRSPPLIYQTNVLGQAFGPSNETKRPSVSPPKLNTRPKSNVWTPPYADLDRPEEPATNPTDLPVPKRTRLPFSTNPGLRGNNSVEDDSERELQAKAKRLARFKDELSQPETNDLGNKYQKPQQLDQLGIDRNKSMGEALDITQHLSADGEEQDSSTVIIGYCPNMCPEQERAERERKGDLDQYERLDGNRNRTTEFLAVKKYTRTAEREALLIRPMEILQKTMDYLLNLLNQPYDDRFLGLYNFLWDRMRAIRMDLRMQHLFNLGAITMLEQMIRLHIIAMHELCQYTKGEGFSEGFDAHLNIEQMNKTSVELFQLYDDHRKKGIVVPTEREFRGYYALLKLDKHPGYKVEPSELSLDLAKMTPGIRQAAEVLFARDVARACRTGNFIAFFRLVRRASYLQACLMHAHFGKLRTQALASLHSGLQNNQGLPVGLVAKWLGMEEENIEDLFEYHGFSVKDFEEPYMVKERQFLNSNTEGPLKCSKLVHLKRSSVVVDDVLSSPLITSSMTPEYPKRVPVEMASTQEESPVVHKEKTQIFTNPNDSHMRDFVDVPSFKNDMRVQPIFTTPVVAINRWTEDHSHMEVASPSPRDHSPRDHSPRDRSPRDSFKRFNSFKSPEVVTSVAKPSFDKSFRNSLIKNGQSSISVIPPQVTTTEVVLEALPDVQMDSPVEDLEDNSVIFQDPEPEEPKNAIQEVPIEIDTSVDEEVAEAKLKLIFRLWRRRTLIKKDLRDKKRLAANAALSSLSLGPPMRHYKEQLKVPGDFNIDRAMCERYDKQEHLWSTLNVSNVVAATLGERHQYQKGICWKLLFCSFDLEPGSKFLNPDPGSWFRHKLMPENMGNNDDLVASLPGLSIWKKWDSRKLSGDSTCYLSVVKDVQFDNLVEETVLGASAVMFLASDCISWESQKNRLHNLVSSIPYGACVPLLIYSGSDLPSSTIVQNLGLNEVENSKIGCFSVVPLDEFFTIEHLTNGLEWLASQSPVQPIVRCVKTRELVLTHLKISNNMLAQFNSGKKRPEQFISAINEALDESINDICNAAKSNPGCWPCPEISLLNEPECTALEPYFPSVGWSSASRIEPLIQALRNCKLPSFQNDISWSPGVDIENQRLQLQDFLVSYLIPLMGLGLAQKETSILIQNFVGLELHGSTYYLVPKWLMIFRRVFNWQLMSLSDRLFSTAYILEQQHNDFLSASKSLEDESYNMISPSLDEMIEVSCCRPGLELDFMELDFMDFESNDLETAVCDSPELEMVVSRDDTAEEEGRNVENERSLVRLLEQCNILQDNIDKKLSVYF